MEKRGSRVGILIISASLLFLLAAGWFDFAGAADKFPTRPVEVIVPAAPGGGTDIIARILAEVIEPYLGQKIVVINKPGGSGTIGLNTVTQAKPDGYTLGFIYNSPLTMVPNVLRVNFTANDFSYIIMIGKGPMLFGVRPEFPAKNAKEFFEYVGKNPGKLTYAGDGVGNIVHFAGERIFHAMNVKLRLIPYGGSAEDMKALLGGHVDVYGGTVTPAVPHIKAGKIRPLFISIREKVEVLPNVPGVSELGPSVPETFIWRGMVGPKGMVPERIAILEKALRQAAQSQKVVDHIRDLGEVAFVAPGKQFEQQAREETAAMAAVSKQLGLSPK